MALTDEIDTICDALAITDTTAHDIDTDSDEIVTAFVHGWQGWIIKAVSTLDAAVTVTMYGNNANSSTNADNFALQLIVLASSVDSAMYSARNDGYFPWVYPSIQASSTPTSGSITLTLIRIDKVREGYYH